MQFIFSHRVGFRHGDVAITYENEVIAAQPLHEVATDKASHGVPDDMHLLVSCLIAHLRNQIPQAGCHRSDVVGPGGVVERVRRPESATVQTPA